MQEEGFKLAFSGGGFRATFYCLGAYRRLVELGIHSSVTSISSVSGGSIAAGMIMTALSDGSFKDIDDFDKRVTEPLKRLGQLNLRKKLMRKIFRWGEPRARFSRLFPILLDRELFHGKLLHQLPVEPEWSCNATCLNTMKRFRFKVTDMYGNKLGVTKDIEDITVAFAVATSAAYPLIFAPIPLDNSERKYEDKYGSSAYSSLPQTIYLTDGGVYDNLGSEAILKEDKPFIVVDASASTTPWDTHYAPNYFMLAYRAMEVSMDQIVNLRRRLIYKHSGTGIQLLIGQPLHRILETEKKSRHHEKELPHYPDLSDVEGLIAALRTDLDAFHDIEIDALMWSGAVRMDLAVKSILPQLIPEEKWEEVPLFPDYHLDEVKQVLKAGNKLDINW